MIMASDNNQFYIFLHYINTKWYMQVIRTKQ